jgi:GNAT superfamily N-acetyltransferase
MSITAEPEHQEYLFALNESRDEALRRHIQAILREHNARYAISSPSAQPISIIATSKQGDTVGGLLAQTYWTWLSIDLLVVKESARGRGIGTRLVLQAEDEARRRGCHFARTSTYAFQALHFYERLGYCIVGQLADYPEGATLFWLRKAL